MKKENVQLIVATPRTKKALEELKMHQYLQQEMDENWIYRLK